MFFFNSRTKDIQAWFFTILHTISRGWEIVLKLVHGPPYLFNDESERKLELKLEKSYASGLIFFHVENRGEKTLWASQHWNWSSGINNHQIQLFHFLIVWRLEIEWSGYGSLRHSDQFSFCPSVSPSSCLLLCWLTRNDLSFY